YSHALMSRSEEGWIIEDLDSDAGTLLNGEELKECTPLKDGDIIEICGFTIRFTQKEGG
ncbi:MAG: FHA domain-containing protein, partial [Clostridia bacterium]|nr:FHA domain-containing protein [Clostridia bacterium]